VAFAVLVAAAPVSLARLSSAQPSSAAFTTGSLAAPTSLTASANSSGIVTLGWTATASTKATGYDVLRSTTSGAGYSVVSTVTPRTATTTTNSPGNGTWYYVLQSVYQGWRSASSNEASVTIGSRSTGLKACVSNAADTGGNNNGYESLPGNACAVDGSVATDANSGTNSINSCTNAGKDRHRFWGYAFGLPTSVASVQGVTVQLDAGLNNNGGTSVLCVQLSWDGGGTWSAAKSVTMSGAAIATYPFGGATDTWGRTWVADDFLAANFRVRVIDVSTQPNKDFRLDGVQVAVAYTP
jgi:hypothetical protein